MLASRAEEKSRQKTWISVESCGVCYWAREARVVDCFFVARARRARIQRWNSFLFKCFTTSSRTLIFWRIARQKRYVTQPSVHSTSLVMISITLSRIEKSGSSELISKYSTPWTVLAMTETRAQTACLRPLESMDSMSRRNLQLDFSLSRKMSFLMSSETRLRLYSGDICRAFTLKDRRTSIMFSTFPSDLDLIILFLCSLRTFSEKSCYFSSDLSSVSKILWYFPRSTL
jgi:hypothetical protein